MKKDLEQALASLRTDDRGVSAQASTLGMWKRSVAGGLLYLQRVERHYTSACRHQWRECVHYLPGLLGAYRTFRANGRCLCPFFRSLLISQKPITGALEALLSFLRDMKIPVATVNIGPVHKRDVMKCSTQLQHDPKYAMILAFDVKVRKR